MKIWVKRQKGCGAHLPAITVSLFTAFKTSRTKTYNENTLAFALVKKANILCGQNLCFLKMSPKLRSGRFKWIFCRFWQINHFTAVVITYGPYKYWPCNLFKYINSSTQYFVEFLPIMLLWIFDVIECRGQWWLSISKSSLYNTRNKSGETLSSHAYSKNFVGFCWYFLIVRPWGNPSLL